MEMIKEAAELHLEDMSKEQLQIQHQAVEGTPGIQDVTIQAPSVLQT